MHYYPGMAFYRVPTEFLLAMLYTLTTLSLRFHGAHNACTALSRRSHCANGVLKTLVCTTKRSLSQLYVCSRSLNHATKRGRKKAGLGSLPSSSFKNDVNSVCSILELLDLHIGKKESSLLVNVGHS